METVAEDIFTGNSDYAVRKRCQDREDYLRWQKANQIREERLKEDLEKSNLERDEARRESEAAKLELEELKAFLKKHNLEEEYINSQKTNL